MKTAILHIALVVPALADSATLHSWNVLDYDWKAMGITRNEAINTNVFIPSNNALAGVKSTGGVTFVTVPRWKSGVPSTLNKVVIDSASGETVLQPYPNAWFNNLSNPDGIKYVQSMEIDSQGRMWIIDVGRSFTEGPLSGPAKVVVWNIALNREVERFVLPDDVVDPSSNFLNDIVVDEARMFAYISDANRGLIITVDMVNKRASAFEDASTKNEPSVNFVIEGLDYEFITPSDGIALTPDAHWVYYCALQGLTLYRIPSEVLRAWPLDLEAAAGAVEVVGTKSSQADGMTFAATGVLYSGGITDPDNNVWSYDTNSGAGFKQTALTAAGGDWWADTFAFDGFGNLLYTTNHLNLFFAGTMNFVDPSEPNFCVKYVYVGSSSYVGSSLAPTPAPSASAEPTAEPTRPQPTAAADHNNDPHSGGAPIQEIIFAVAGSAVFVALLTACYFRMKKQKYYPEGKLHDTGSPLFDADADADTAYAPLPHPPPKLDEFS